MIEGLYDLARRTGDKEPKKVGWEAIDLQHGGICLAQADMPFPESYGNTYSG